MNSENKNIYIITGILFLITTSVNLEMPLFRLYAENENFGVGMVGFAFASYIGGLLPTVCLVLIKNIGWQFSGSINFNWQ